MRAGECWARQTLVRGTGGSESGLWPTPCASASKGSSPASLTRSSGADRSNDRIDHAVMASDGGQLSPDWVEWLMGWPISWTSLDPLPALEWPDWSVDPADDGSVPRVGRKIPNRAARLRCIGNGQVPPCAAEAWTQLAQQRREDE